MHAFSFIIEQHDPPVEILVLELAPGESLAEMFEKNYKVGDGDARRRASFIVVRPPVATPLDQAIIEKILQSGGTGEVPPIYSFLVSALTDLLTFARAPGKPVHILASCEYQHFISTNINPKASKSPLDTGILSKSVAIDAIKNAEIDLIVTYGRAQLPAMPGVLYRAPSQRLMRSFLRVGNIQRSRAILDALLFWMLPHLKDCVGLITDTWSISSISMNASRRLALYANTGRPCPVEMLGHYHDGSPAQAAEAAEIVDGILARAMAGADRPQRRRIVFLISATHTGSLAKSLRSLLHKRNIPDEAVHFLALFKLAAGATPIDALRDFSSGDKAAAFAPIENDKADAVEIIDIDDQVYFPLQYRDIKHNVRASSAAGIKSFLQRYKNLDLFRVHKTVRDDGPLRHHAIWVDTYALINDARFKDSFIDHIKKLTPLPKLIVTPCHASAEALGALAQRALSEAGMKAHLFSHSTLLFAPTPQGKEAEIANALDSIAEDEAILVLDDAFITGSRLGEYSTHLRGFRGLIHYRVALARATSIHRWETQRRMFAYRAPNQSGRRLPQHTVDAIETFVLPDWHEERCPWCLEAAFYRKREAESNAVIAEATLQSRLAMLTSSPSAGLSTSLFLSVPSLPPLELTPNSIFADAPVPQAVVFAAVASAIQHLRTFPIEQKPPLGPRHFPLSTVIDDNDYFGDTYTDAVLRASFLRAAQSNELVFAGVDSERERTERARQLILSETPTKANIATEILLAWAFGKLPELALKDPPLRRRLDELGIRSIAEIFSAGV